MKLFEMIIANTNASFMYTNRLFWADSTARTMQACCVHYLVLSPLFLSLPVDGAQLPAAHSPPAVRKYARPAPAAGLPLRSLRALGQDVGGHHVTQLYLYIYPLFF